MTIQLRPYQQEFIKAISEALAKHRRVIACAATGSGKSKTFIAITRRAVERGTTVLIITEARKIFKQLTDEIGNCHEISPDVKYVDVRPAHIYVAMAQTLARREAIITAFHSLPQANLLIITDEAHVGTPTKLLQRFPDAYHIGFTATPDYRFAKHLPTLYNDCVVGAQPRWLVDNKYLSPYRHFVRRVVDLDGLEKGASGDFSESSQERVFDRIEVADTLLADLTSYPFRKAIIYCASIKHASDVAAELRNHGLNIAEVHTSNPKSDWELFNFMQFAPDSPNVCVSVGILTKGFDFPEIDLIVLNRATTSLPLYLQMCGRGSRLAQGKPDFTVLDYGGNAARHGLWDAERPWAEMWRKKRKPREGVAPIKECPACLAVLAPFTSICPECGYTFTVDDETPQEKVATRLTELTINYSALNGRRISTLTPRELATYVERTGRKSFATRVAKALGEVYLCEYATEMRWKSGWEKHIQPSKAPFNDIIIFTN